jgi:hypothetical protein
LSVRAARAWRGLGCDRKRVGFRSGFFQRGTVEYRGGLRAQTADKAALEQPGVHRLHATQGVVVHHYAGQPTIFGQRVRLRPDGLSGEDATNRGELGVTVQQLDVACQLLHGVQTGYPLDLDRQ